MSPRTRGALEGSLGADLGGVRVHGDTAARSTAASLGARAFAVGSGIYLGPGASDEDLGLMAHETTHVLQGGAGVIRRAPAAGAPPAPPPPAPAPAPAPIPVPVAPPAADAAAPKAADKKKKKEEKGKKKKGGAEEKGAAAPEGAPAGGGGPSVEILMPEPRLTLAPGEKAAVGKVKENANKKAAAEADLPAADVQVADAKGAVKEPEEETAARAQQGLVKQLQERQPPSPAIILLCLKIYAAIRAKRPPDEDDLVDAKPQEAAEAAGGELSGSVQSDTKKVEGSYDALQTPPAGTPEKVPEGLDPAPPPLPVPVAAAEAASPEAVPPAEVSLDADVEASAAKMDEAGMNKPAAQLVQNGPIAEARAAQGELGEVAKKGPAEALAEQRAALGKASGEMAELQAKALTRLAKSRDKTVEGTGGQKQDMVGSEEEMRAAAGKEAADLFKQAQSDVRDQLRGLPDTAMKKWEEGKKLLSLQFDQSLAWIKGEVEERHSGVGGAILGAVDYVTGLPDWVVEEYDAAEKAFGDGVCALILEISSDVNTVVAACEQIVEDARVEIKKVFDRLPDSLDAWAAEQQTAMGKQLDGLANEARETRDTFNKDLGQRAATAVQEARSKIHELRQAAGGLLGRIASAIGRFLDDPIKFIIDGLLELVGIEPSRFWSLIARIKSVVSDIVDDPIGFAGNMLAGIAQGFTQFFDRFGTHLTAGFFDWLTAGLAKAGITLPTDFSMKGILTFILQLMGITWDRIKKLLARRLGDKNVALIDKAWSMISMLIEKGPEGIFELVKEKLDPRQIIDQIITAGVNFLVEGLVKAVSFRILAMLNPVGAIVQAIEAIYRVIKWVFENAARLFTLVEAVVNGMAQVVAGNISGMAAAVETALAGLIAPVIDFLADYMGLGGLPEKIKGVIEGMQAWVEGILATVIDFIADRAQGLLVAMGVGGTKEPPPGKESAPPGEDQVGENIPFGSYGEDHHVWIAVEGDSAVPMVASDTPRPIESRLREWDQRLHTLSAERVSSVDKPPQEEAGSLIAEARRLNVSTDQSAEKLLDTYRKPSGAGTVGGAPGDAEVVKREKALARVLDRLFYLFSDNKTGGDLTTRFASFINEAPEQARFAIKTGVKQVENAKKEWPDWQTVRAEMEKTSDNPVHKLLAGPISNKYLYGRWVTEEMAVPAVQLAAEAVKKQGGKVPERAEKDPEDYVDSHKGSINAGKGSFLESGNLMRVHIWDARNRGQVENELLDEFLDNLEGGGKETHNLYKPKDLVAYSIISTREGVVEYETYAGAKFKVTVNPSGRVNSVQGRHLQFKTKVGVTDRGVTQRSQGYVVNEVLNASHLIADRFLGSGYKEGNNLITTSAEFNQGSMARAEDRIEEFIDTEKAVTFDMDVTVHWGDVNTPDVMNVVLAQLPDQKPAEVVAAVQAFAARVASVSHRVMDVRYLVKVKNGLTDAEVEYRDFTGPDVWLGLARSVKR